MFNYFDRLTMLRGARKNPRFALQMAVSFVLSEKPDLLNTQDAIIARDLIDTPGLPFSRYTIEELLPAIRAFRFSNNSQKEQP